MNIKKHLAMLVVVCLVFLGAAPMALSEGLLGGDLANYMLFDLTFREAMDAAPTSILTMHPFKPLYSDGRWVRTYFFGESAYMQVLVTSIDVKGAIIAVNIISGGKESPLYRALTGYAIAALRLNVPRNLQEMNDSSADLAAEMDLASAGYVLTNGEDGTMPYISLRTTKPYEVEDYIAIPTDEGVMYSLPAGVATVEAFTERLETVLSDYCGLSDPLLLLAVNDESDGKWLHLYSAGNIVLAISADGEETSANIAGVNVLDFSDDPPSLVLVGEAAFAALVGFEQEQFVAMSLLCGARTLFEDFMSLLPVVAYGDSMLLFGESSERAAAYIMGVPNV